MREATVSAPALPYRIAGAWRLRANPLIGQLASPLGVFLLFSIVTLAVFWKWLPHLRTALLGPPEDNMQDFWNTWYVAVSATSDPFFTNLIRFPEGTPLYYHSFAYPKLFAIALIWKVIGGADRATLILLQNISLLASFPLAGTATFYLVRHFTRSNIGAALGGFIFAFNPSHVQHALHHAGVSAIEFIPLFVLCYLLAIERRSLLLMMAAIAFYALSALSCWYHLFYLAYFMAFHVMYVAICDRVLPSGRQLFTSLGCMTGVLIVLAPLLLPMMVAALGGASVYVEGADVYVADLTTFVAFPPNHILGPLGDGIYARVTGNAWEATAYLGLINMAVLAWLCFAAPAGNQRLIRYVLWGMAVFSILAVGDSLHIFGHSVIPMPGSLLSQLPFFSNVRTPSRAIVIVYMFLAIGVGHAIGLALKNSNAHAARWGVAIVALLIGLDFLPARGLPTTPVTCSRGLDIIRQDSDKDFGVLDLPSWDYNEELFYMLQQAACHNRPIVRGTTSRDLVVSLRDRLEFSDFEAQRRQLAGAKVKYIVLHSRGESIDLRFTWLQRDGPRSRYLETYRVVYDSPDLVILRVY